MMDLSRISPATHLAEEVYTVFIETVLEVRVARHRVGINSEKTRQKVADGEYRDTRFIHLMTISGKGGYSPNAAEFAKRAIYTNITLLDHLLSVGRGAMLFYTIDCIANNPRMESDLLKKHLSTLLALGFMHDADKIAKIARNEKLTLEIVQKISNRYGIDAFCRHFGIELSPAQWLGLIARVEGTQTHRYMESHPAPRGMERLPLYVGYADKLDGIWLLDDAEKGGIEGIFKRFEKDRAIENNPLGNWQPLVLRDPHHPFLLDELQRWISLECRRMIGVPPLIETHHDGELCMLLPKGEFDGIVQKGLDRLYGNLPFNLKLDVSNRGVPSLYNIQPTYRDLRRYLQEDAPEDKISSLFQVKYEVSQAVWENLIDFLDEIDVTVNLPKKTQGLVSLFAGFENLDEMEITWIRKAALLVLLLNLKIKAPAKTKIPDYDEREKSLLHAINLDPPGWITVIKDAPSKRVLTAIWVGGLAVDDEEIDQRIFGEDGLLQNWLEGTQQTKGLREFITGGGEQVVAAIRTRFESLLTHTLIKGDMPDGKGRCLFTGEPVSFENAIAQADGLYEVKVSAFSGRDNRPESISIQRAHTNVSATSIAEHIIRSDIHKAQGGKKNGVPNLISSPSTLGLFGGLGLTSDKAMDAMSVYDLSRQDIKKGRTLKGTEMYSRRWRMARFERMPEKTVAQIDLLRLLLNASLRTGRPLHLFRGLPVKQKAFFHFDAMPRLCQELLGGKSLRIEQIPQAIERLETARAIGETAGLGYDILRLYAQPTTRFQAICLACGMLEEKGQNGNAIHNLKLQFEAYWKGVTQMTEQDGALVELGRLAAGIQQWPKKGSGREERLVFNLCMDAAVQCRAAGQEDRQSLVYAISGELENNLVRKGKALSKKDREGIPLMDACITAAELFVDKVWSNALKGRVPSHKTRRLFAEIYRMSFLQTHRENSKKHEESC